MAKVISSGGALTPWTENIDAADNSLTGLKSLDFTAGHSVFNKLVAQTGYTANSLGIKSGTNYHVLFNAAETAYVGFNVSGNPALFSSTNGITFITFTVNTSEAVNTNSIRTNKFFAANLTGSSPNQGSIARGCLFANDITDTTSMELVFQDEQNVTVENGGKVFSRTVTHSDTSTYNLYTYSTTEGLRIPTDTVCAFDILVTGITSGAAVAVAYKAEGLIVNDGGTTAFVGTPTVTAIDESEDDALAVTLVADDTNDRLQVVVEDTSGDAGQVKWKAVARVNMTQFL